LACDLAVVTFFKMGLLS